ncbi:DEP domain-containing protein 1A isoform X1 [Amphiprion ocellaris]|uniref:DEP domain-containing protein n=1 Tax=Amphiprion ocellaris TaxID=80972 RepID=A0A3Q1CAA0_AMPOC|nr:DEP domain-containing protein 1A isoform X1 [Amphiprion ocellaris]
MSSHVITPGPYRATKLWNEVTRLFRAGMPLRKHRQNFRHYSSCFTASAAVDWLHQLLCSNSNFGPDVTRQQTVQLLKKFLKNHVIEDVKGRWGTEDLEDSNTLYRFPSTSPLKPIPCPAPASSSIKKRSSFRDKEGFFKFRSFKKHEKESLENVDPALQAQQDGEKQPLEEQETQRRELTVDDEQDIWRDITLTHLQRILGVASFYEVLDPRCVNPQNIIHNMTKVNKHGVVTLDDKNNDLPHWVLSAMKSLANWPKYDSAQPSYPGFERDVFKTVSDYFYSLPQPLLTYELYELFINVLVFCGYVAAPTTHQRGKRKKSDLPSVPPPAKSSFRSTECLLLSLLRQGTCDEAESPMTDVLGGKLQSRLAALKGGSAGDGQIGGSCMSLSTAVSVRPQTRSCSLENVLDDSAPLTRQQLFSSSDSLTSCAYSNRSQDDSPAIIATYSHSDFTSKTPSVTCQNAPGAAVRNRLSVASIGGLSAAQRLHHLRPHSVGSCLDIVIETREEDVKEVQWQGRATSCLDVSTPASQNHSSASRPPSLPSHHPSSSSCDPLSSSFVSAVTKAQAATGPSGPRPASSTSNLWTLPAPAVVRRCLSSLDVSKPSRPISLFKPPVCVPTSSSQLLKPKPEHSVLQPQCERVAIEALQLCTLLLPPALRRKLQLLMRMMSRISQNVDMPRLHPAIGTRTLMVHTFSGCVLGSAEECDLDELLATRLVSFLMDHQQNILSVPEYLLSAISDHIQYLRTVQIPIDSVSNTDGGDPVCAPVPIYAFCHQISSAEFEEQKLASSQKAMEELLEILLTDQNISEKDRRKKLKQFQKQYPDIYRCRFPSSDKETKTDDKPKIKPPLLNIKKTKAFSIRT